MKADLNYYSTRSQTLFVCYEDIIKLNYAVMLKEICEEYYDDLISILDLDSIKGYDIHNLNRYVMERPFRNPLYGLCRNKEDYPLCDSLLNTFEDEMINMYTHSEFTEFGAKFYNVLMQPIVNKVYMYTEKKSYQILYDCQVHFNQFAEKIEYVFGDFESLVKAIEPKPTTYILNDVDKARILVENNLVECTELLIAELGYNFTLNNNADDIVLKYDIEPLMKEKIFKVGYMPVINLEPKHFSAISELKKPEDNA